MYAALSYYLHYYMLQSSYFYMCILVQSVQLARKASIEAFCRASQCSLPAAAALLRALAGTLPL